MGSSVGTPEMLVLPLAFPGALPLVAGWWSVAHGGSINFLVGAGVWLWP